MFGLRGRGRAQFTLPWTRLGSLLGEEHFLLHAACPNRTTCKRAMKDEGGINKRKDFSETTYCKCDRIGWGGWQCKVLWKIAGSHCFISLTLELFLKMKILGKAKDFLPQGLQLLRNWKMGVSLGRDLDGVGREGISPITVYHVTRVYKDYSSP